MYNIHIYYVIYNYAELPVDWLWDVERYSHYSIYFRMTSYIDWTWLKPWWSDSVRKVVSYAACKMMHSYDWRWATIFVLIITSNEALKCVEILQVCKKSLGFAWRISWGPSATWGVDINGYNCIYSNQLWFHAHRLGCNVFNYYCHIFGKERSWIRGTMFVYTYIYCISDM